jgi:hypothetical protein
MRRAARAVVDAVPGSEYTEVPGQGHVPAPAALGALIDRVRSRIVSSSS